MKAIVEKYLEGNLSNVEKWMEFNEILQVIQSAKNDLQLSKLMSEREFKFFDAGFGGHHMWVSEKGNNDRLILVLFQFDKQISAAQDLLDALISCYSLLLEDPDTAEYFEMDQIKAAIKKAGGKP